MPDATHAGPLVTFGTAPSLDDLERRRDELVEKYNALPDDAPGELRDKLIVEIGYVGDAIHRRRTRESVRA